MKHYVLPMNGICKEEAVIQGNQYRITVLTPSLLRLEYSDAGYFEDRPTQSVINRDFPATQFSVIHEMLDGQDWLIVETEKLRLRYNGMVFSPEGLQIEVKEIDDAIWRYGQELHDLKGTYRTLDRVDGDIYISHDGRREKIELGNGIISREGFSLIDDSKSMVLTEDGWIEPRKECVDLYFFGYGHRYLEALNDFYHLCGSTPLLPRYALGNWWSRYHRYTEEEYKKLITRFQQEKLPFSVAVIDMDWHLVSDVDPKYGSGWTGYTWNRKLFPDPEEFMCWLHDQNMKVTLNVHPADGVRAYEEIYPKLAKALGIDPATEEAIKFDPSDPTFMEEYFEVLCHDLEQQGVDFWWIDWQQGSTSNLPGLDPLWMLNHFHYLDSAWKGTRSLTFSRYAGVGSHRYPIGFSGDTAITWESLAYQPYFTNTASNIGYGWWSHDIGGHMWGSRDDELLARWVQYGVFSPINRLHSSNNPFVGKEPWRYDAVTEQTMSKYLRLRHAMVPYLYTMNRRSNKENLPLIQPMYYLEPDREEAYQVPNEYYFGTELLVSPITQPVDPVSRAAKVRTWLPEGLWADMFTGTVYHGGRMVDLWRPVDDIPVLMKSGAIIPMKDMECFDNSVENPGALTVHVFPSKNSGFVLCEDAGDTPVDRDDNWAYTQLSWNDDTFTINAANGNVSVIPEKRCWKLVFCAVENIFTDGRELADILNVSVDGKLTNVEVSYDEGQCRFVVIIPETDVSKDIVVTFKSKFTIADNTKQHCFKVLQRAQMNYDLKKTIWDVIELYGKDSATDLSKIEMDKNVRDCLLEVL